MFVWYDLYVPKSFILVGHIFATLDPNVSPLFKFNSRFERTNNSIYRISLKIVFQFDKIMALWFCV